MVNPPSPIALSLQPFGETIFTEISRLAAQHSAVNLGQGFPNFDGPDFVKHAAIEALQAGHNQYSRMYGIPPLNAAIAHRFLQNTGLSVDPEREITVTCGCTEAIAATLLGLLNPGDEIVLIEPFYDCYRACAAMSGATARFITLRPPHFEITQKALDAAFTKRTKAVLVNTPHNPTGKVFTRHELMMIAAKCIELDVIALFDEVYDQLVFDCEHISLATLPGMRERTITLSSLGKTFSLTGWKIGWAIAPPPLTAAVRSAHQFLTFAAATPLQHGAAAALHAPATYYEQFRRDYRQKRDTLVAGLEEVGFRVFTPQGTYFILADHTPFGMASDSDFCKHLIKEVGVAAIPTSVFYSNPEDGKSLVRFAFCKTVQTLEEAISRMKEKLKLPQPAAAHVR